jgi:hypothetical protein
MRRTGLTSFKRKRIIKSVNAEAALGLHFAAGAEQIRHMLPTFEIGDPSFVP